MRRSPVGKFDHIKCLIKKADKSNAKSDVSGSLAEFKIPEDTNRLKSAVSHQEKWNKNIVAASRQLNKDLLQKDSLSSIKKYNQEDNEHQDEDGVS